ncbi:hypothetical protein DL96DRAFT_718073 [Flagelloscypha sp. PMI_526]|nr:hypothetical protein DL96DRAFT_718073 [Flagelloscypha sp. PMI_526]
MAMLTEVATGALLKEEASRSAPRTRYQDMESAPASIPQPINFRMPSLVSVVGPMSKRDRSSRKKLKKSSELDPSSSVSSTTESHSLRARSVRTEGQVGIGESPTRAPPMPTPGKKFAFNILRSKPKDRAETVSIPDWASNAPSWTSSHARSFSNGRTLDLRIDPQSTYSSESPWYYQFPYPGDDPLERGGQVRTDSPILGLLKPAKSRAKLSKLLGPVDPEVGPTSAPPKRSHSPFPTIIHHHPLTASPTESSFLSYTSPSPIDRRTPTRLTPSPFPLRSRANSDPGSPKPNFLESTSNRTSYRLSTVTCFVDDAGPNVRFSQVDGPMEFAPHSPTISSKHSSTSSLQSTFWVNPSDEGNDDYDINMPTTAHTVSFGIHPAEESSDEEDGYGEMRFATVRRQMHPPELDLEMKDTDLLAPTPSSSSASSGSIIRFVPSAISPPSPLPPTPFTALSPRMPSSRTPTRARPLPSPSPKSAAPRSSPPPKEALPQTRPNSPVIAPSVAATFSSLHGALGMGIPTTLGAPNVSMYQEPKVLIREEYNAERTNGWKGEWNQTAMEDVVAKLRALR